MKCLTSDISQHILILSLFTVDIFKIQVFFWVDVHRYTGTDNTDTWAHVIKSSAAEVHSALMCYLDKYWCNTDKLK